MYEKNILEISFLLSHILDILDITVLRVSFNSISSMVQFSNFAKWSD